MQPRFQEFKAHWHAHLNQIDLVLGRGFYVSRWLTLRPHIGLRSTWIWQRLRVAYTHPIATFNIVGDPFEVHKRNNWWGFGPEAGLETEWGFSGGFSLYGTLVAAIEYGFHKLRNIEEDERTETKTVRMKDSVRECHPILDLQMGVRWDYMFFHDRIHFGLQLGWEQHTYFAQNQFPYFVDNTALGSFTTNNGNLSYQGWNLGAILDF